MGASAVGVGGISHLPNCDPFAEVDMNSGRGRDFFQVSQAVHRAAPVADCKMLFHHGL
jgi:hypothetical protein